MFEKEVLKKENKWDEKKDKEAREAILKAEEFHIKARAKQYKKYIDEIKALFNGEVETKQAWEMVKLAIMEGNIHELTIEIWEAGNTISGVEFKES